MNWRTKAAAVATALLVLGSVTSTAVADDQAEGSTTINEGGTFRYWIQEDTVSFGTQSVSTTTGGTLTTTGGTNLEVIEQRTSSPGWTLQLTASDFTTGDGEDAYFIDNDNLSISSTHLTPFQSCLSANPPAEVGNNEYQNVALLTAPQSLSTPVNLAVAGEGRGCNRFIFLTRYQLDVPPGTATGLYTSDLTLTNIVEEPE